MLEMHESYEGQYRGPGWCSRAGRPDCAGWARLSKTVAFLADAHKERTREVSPFDSVWYDLVGSFRRDSPKTKMFRISFPFSVRSASRW